MSKPQEPPETSAAGEISGRSAFVRTGYNAALGSGRDFMGRWRAAERRPYQAQSSRDYLIIAYCIVTIPIIAVLFDANAAHAARTLGLGWQHFFGFVTDFGKSGYLFALTALTCALASAGSGVAISPRTRAGLSVLAARSAYLFIVLAGSGIAAQVLKRIGRGRPKFLDEGGAFQFNPLVIKSSWASFPSGHTITVFAFAMALGYFLPKWRVALFAAAALVGASRIAVGAHYPSDVVAGACIGVASAVLLRRVFAARAMVFRVAGGDIIVRGRGMLAAVSNSVLKK